MPEPKKIKAKVKNWYTIIARSILNNALLGETYVSSSSEIIGKFLTVSLMQITNDSKNQNINLKFQVTEVENNQGIADVVGYEIMPSTIRRLVRKDKMKLELSFVCETVDKVKIRIKPLAIIRKDTKGSTESSLRKQTKEFLIKAIQKMNYNNLILDMVNYKLQDAIREHLKKVYPLKTYEFKQMYVLNNVAANAPPGKI